MRRSWWAALLFSICVLQINPAHAAVTGVAGGGFKHSNLQPVLGLNYIIHVSDTTLADLGDVRLFAGNYAPGGWNLCDGTIYPVAGNQTLFQRLGAAYGGDGLNDFALPD